VRQVYLNGSFVPEDEASISILDRGFIFGDGVYELLPAYGGTPFRLQQHLARLRSSLLATGIPEPLNDERWSEVIYRLLELNGGGEQTLYIQITRGVAPRDHVVARAPSPTVLIMTSPLQQREPEAVSAITRDDIRWQRCNIKTTSLLANVLLRNEAANCGSYEAILIRDGLVSEGAASNVFVVLDGVIKTPPDSKRLLPGITRDLVLELCEHHGVHNEVVDIPGPELKQASEIWLTSSAREIVPVIRLDGAPVGSGEIGPRWKQIWALYREYKQEFGSGDFQGVYARSSASSA